MNPLTNEQVIHRENYDNYNAESDMEYLSKSIDEESLSKMRDQFIAFTEKGLDEGWLSGYIEAFIRAQLTVLGLVTNLGHPDMMHSYHIDTWERDDYWRVQIYVSTSPTGLSTALLQCPYCKYNDIYLGGERGYWPKIKVDNGSITVTIALHKNPDFYINK